MKKTLFITMLAAALLGGNVYANTGFSGGEWLWGSHDDVVAKEGETLLIFEAPYSDYEQLGNVYGLFDFGAGKGSVAIQGGIVQNAYGGYVASVDMDAVYCKVKMTGGTVSSELLGGKLHRI